MAWSWASLAASSPPAASAILGNLNPPAPRPPAQRQRGPSCSPHRLGTACPGDWPRPQSLSPVGGRCGGWLPFRARPVLPDTGRGASRDELRSRAPGGPGSWPRAGGSGWGGRAGELAGKGEQGGTELWPPPPPGGFLLGFSGLPMQSAGVGTVWGETPQAQVSGRDLCPPPNPPSRPPEPRACLCQIPPTSPPVGPIPSPGPRTLGPQAAGEHPLVPQSAPEGPAPLRHHRPVLLPPQPPRTTFHPRYGEAQSCPPGVPVAGGVSVPVWGRPQASCPLASLAGVQPPSAPCPPPLRA